MSSIGERTSIGIIVGILVVLGGCKTRLYDPPLGFAVGDLATSDLATVDLGEPVLDLAGCAAHQSIEVDVMKISLVDPPEWLAVGRALRVKVSVPLRVGCDLPGTITPSTTGMSDPCGGGDAVEKLDSYAWISSNAPCGPMQMVDSVILVLSEPKADSSYCGRCPSPSLNLVVEDGATILPQQHLPCAPCASDPVAIGMPCMHDTQCRAADPLSLCVPSGSNSGTCAIPCATDADCNGMPGLPTCTGAIPFTCGTSDTCHVDGDCPFGQRCQIDQGAHACRPAQDGLPGTPCTCDADCGYGGICNTGAFAPGCQIPCQHSSDCPKGRGCYDPGRCV